DRLLRASVLRLGAGNEDSEHTVLLAMHHIVSDAWSRGVLAGELAALYTAYADGAPPLLPELPVQYADFARWQRDWLQGDVLAAELAFWRRRLGAGPPPLALPADRPRPPGPGDLGHRGGAL